MASPFIPGSCHYGRDRVRLSERQEECHWLSNVRVAHIRHTPGQCLLGSDCSERSCSFEARSPIGAGQGASERGALPRDVAVAVPEIHVVVDLPEAAGVELFADHSPDDLTAVALTGEHPGQPSRGGRTVDPAERAQLAPDERASRLFLVLGVDLLEGLAGDLLVDALAAELL